MASSERHLAQSGWSQATPYKLSPQTDTGGGTKKAIEATWGEYEKIQGSIKGQRGPKNMP